VIIFERIMDMQTLESSMRTVSLGVEAWQGSAVFVTAQVPPFLLSGLRPMSKLACADELYETDKQPHSEKSHTRDPSARIPESFIRHGRVPYLCLLISFPGSDQSASTAGYTILYLSSSSYGIYRSPISHAPCWFTVPSPSTIRRKGSTSLLQNVHPFPIFTCSQPT
jgi:hypothetical protein